ncbi:unnamed protein product [Cuscuta campestris]|uniref:Uncharacterized protein n=1 Tax=Cuscuta campestris TaxID=132261 RepID=A0A484LER6_9ASTE|nr:unnamed protein product [Cuscuta campestris]
MSEPIEYAYIECSGRKEANLALEYDCIDDDFGKKLKVRIVESLPPKYEDYGVQESCFQRVLEMVETMRALEEVEEAEQMKIVTKVTEASEKIKVGLACGITESRQKPTSRYCFGCFLEYPNVTSPFLMNECWPSSLVTPPKPQSRATRSKSRSPVNCKQRHHQSPSLSPSIRRARRNYRSKSPITALPRVMNVIGVARERETPFALSPFSSF